MRYEKSERRKRIMVYFMTIIMFGSAFAFIFLGFRTGGATGSLEYNGFEFVNRGNFWSTTVDGKGAFFTYYPADVGTITIDGDIVNRLRNIIEIDVTSDFNDAFAQEIALAQFNMGITLNNFGVFIRQGFINKTQNYPVITCEDATAYVPVIYFKSSTQTSVYLKNDCIIAQSSNNADFERIKDRLLYGIFGII